MITGEVNARLQADGVLHLPRSGVNIEVEQDEDGFYVNHIVPGGIPAGGGGGSVTVDDALSATSENPVQNKAIKAALDGKGTYSKPSGGVPKSDLANAVQTSLGKADTALQEHQDISGKAAVTSVPASASVSAAGMLSFANSEGTQLFTVQLPLYTGGVS